jgi:glycosyltransferase involved in cell wall biosynthesis
VVIWIDWYAYHVARFKGLQSAFGTSGEVYGIELVGGVGVHKGYKFREGRSDDLPVETLRPEQGWHEAGKLGLALSLVRKLNEKNPELVLVPGYYTLPAVAAALWCKFRGRISVLMTESTAVDHVRKGWRERLKSTLIRSLFDWAVTGGAAHDRYLLQLGFPPDRIAHFYDVVGNASIAEGVAELRQGASTEMHSLPGPYFLFVGRLAPEKNVVGLLQAWLSYRRSGGAWPLVLAGDGPDCAALKQLVAERGLEEEVRFLGHRSARELLPVYAFAGCFVLPSTREPWGLVVNEAMAASLPVIVSARCGCAEDLVRQGENGYVFEPRDEQQLSSYLLKMSGFSKEELAEMGAASAQRIARFSPGNFGQEIAAIADGRSKSGSGGSRLAPDKRFQERASMLLNTPGAADLSQPAVQRAGTASEEWLHVLSHIDPVYGGLSAVVPRLADQLTAQEGIGTSIAAFCGPEETGDAHKQQKRALSIWPMGRYAWLTQTELKNRFRSRVAASKGVHIHGIWESSTLQAASAARRAGIPYILSAHGMLERWALANKRVKKLLYAGLFEHRNVEGAACLHALTQAEAEDYRRFGCKGPIAVIPNGVDAPSGADAELFLREFPVARGKQIVLFLGRIHFKKGVDLLVQAWKTAAQAHPEALLVLAGPDSEGTLAGVEETISRLQLTHRVLVTGMLRSEMKWSALAAADYFVLPSYSEGLSVAALEALSMGVPLILSEQCNLPRVAQAGAGWQVRTDVAELAKVIDIALQSTPEVRRDMSQRARMLAEREFGWASVTERMAQLYRWVNGGELPRNVELLVGVS